MNDESLYSAGTQVRLKNDPGRVGILTGKSKERAGTMMYQVAFTDGKSFQPEYELEVIDDDQDLESLIENGRFGRVTDFRRNLSHIQLCGRLANLVYSMDTTNTHFYAYQFKPVLSFLESPSNGLLIADEVGLGKTIEAGLIWTELRARYDARRLLVVCPAMLCEKWRTELGDKFGVNARIMDAKELLLELRRNKHEIPDGQAIICSLQGIRPPKNWLEMENLSANSRGSLAQFLEEAGQGEPLIDLMIIDEAQHLRNPGSQSAKLGLLLREVSEHVVLLSATPINLRDEDLFHLLKLVDPDSFDVIEVFPQVLEANEPLLKARALSLDTHATSDSIKEILIEAQSHSLLKNNLQLKELIDMNMSPELLANRAERINLANRIEKINLLRHVVNRTKKREVTEWSVIREPYTEFIDLSEQERSFYQSVTEAVSEYALTANINKGFLLASPQRQISSCMYAAAKSWKNRIKIDVEQLYEDFGIEDEVEPDISPLIDFLTKRVLIDFDIEILRQNDSKYTRFRTVLRDHFKKHPKEKVIVFSYFRGTLEYLFERLQDDGISSRILMGGMKQSKQEIIDHFHDNESMRVLLSSEVASEGVDLQFCRVLVNYDLPWNPMKIEQRIGRIDRIGQQADRINIWNLCYANTIDHRIHDRLFMRLGIFERALGGLEAILGEKIEALTSELLSRDLTEQQQNDRIEQTAMAIERIRQDRDDLEKQASHLIAHGGYILEQVQAAHDFKKRITEQDLIAYVKDYLDSYCEGHQFYQPSPDQLVFDIRLPPLAAAQLDEFIQKKKLYGQTRLASGEEIKCQFINKVVNRSRRIECISQFHPLIRFINEDLHHRNEAYHPLIAIRLSHLHTFDLPQGQYAFSVNLWSFTGLRTEEEIRSRVISLDDGNLLDPDHSWDLVNNARVEGNDWLSASNDVDRKQLIDALDICLSKLLKDFEQARREKENENLDRVSFQIESSKRHKDRKLKMHYEALEKLKSSSKKKRLIPAREGMIKKENERFEVQAEKLKIKSNLNSSQQEICSGIISIE